MWQAPQRHLKYNLNNKNLMYTKYEVAYDSIYFCGILSVDFIIYFVFVTSLQVRASIASSMLQVRKLRLREPCPRSQSLKVSEVRLAVCSFESSSKCSFLYKHTAF
jgi:hypothetical protein